MKSPLKMGSVVGMLRKRPALAGGVLLALLVVVGLFAARPKTTAQARSFFEAKRGDFLISVVEGGTIEAVNEVVVRSEVEGIARIIYIVPEGHIAKKGDLLVELDSAATQDAVNLQQIAVERAQFALIQAEQQLDREEHGGQRSEGGAVESGICPV
jgi:HlyD family secretion protein